MTNFAEKALEHLKAVTYDADRAQVFALLDIAAAIRESKPAFHSRIDADAVAEAARWHLNHDA